MKHILNAGILFGVAAVLITSGCATTGSGASDGEQISALLEQWKQAILAKNVDALMATYSENFAHDGYEYEAPDKAAFKEYIEGSIDMGGFDNVEVDLESANISIEDGKATVYPIDYTNWEGSIVIELTLAKEKQGWMITDMAIEGL